MSRLYTPHMTILYDSSTDRVENPNLPEANYNHFLCFSYSSDHWRT